MVRRSGWQEEFDELSVAGKVMNALMERLGPQYHLLENAEELRAHPLLSIEQQAHYFMPRDRYPRWPSHEGC
jgi:hypothetical protein